MDLQFRNKQLLIFSCLFFGYAFYAYNRKSVSLALPALMERGMTKNEAGLIASSQNLAFAISKFFSGILSDRISARILFSFGLLLSGTATLVFASYDSLLVFTFLWFLNGIGQGAGWPACAKVIRQWSPPEQFGTWWSVLSASTNVSGAVTPFIAAMVILSYGWQASLILAGSISVGMGALCLIVIINTPADLGWKSYAPSLQVKKQDVVADSDTTWKDLLSSPFLWVLSLGYMVTFCGKTAAVDWGQMFLMEDLKHSQYAASAFTSSLETGGFFGGVASGYITDWLLKRSRRENSNPRMPVAFWFTAGLVAGLHILCFWVMEDTSQLFVSSLGFYLGMCFYGAISIFGVVAAETAPPHLSGTAHAFVALAGNVGAIVSGLPFSYIAKLYNWCAVFILMEAVTMWTVIIMFLFRNIKGQIGRVKKE